MNLWNWVETKISVGEQLSDRSFLRTKAQNGQTRDERSMAHMELFRFYTTEAHKRKFLSPLFRHIAQRHLREAMRSAEYYPDPSEMHAALLGKRGDLRESANEFEEVIVKQQVWIQVFKDPDGSRQQTLCLDMATLGATYSLLGRFDESLFWYEKARAEFNQLSLTIRSEQANLEDSILAGILTSYLALFRYQEALAFIQNTLQDQMFSAYQSKVRCQFHAQVELLPEIANLTRGYEFPEEGLALWTKLMDEVQQCNNPEEAREIRRRIFDRIDMHESTQQVRDLRDAIVALLPRNSQIGSTINVSLPTPTPPPDLSIIKDSDRRKDLEEFVRTAKIHREMQERTATQMNLLFRTMDQAMASLTQAAITNVSSAASGIYRVPRWFRARWDLYAVARLAAKFLAIEFFLGILLEHFLRHKEASLAEFFHFNVRELTIDVAAGIMIFVVSMPLERKLDKAFLTNYKRLLQRLVSDRVANYWITYNTLLEIYISCKAKIAEATNVKIFSKNLPLTKKETS